MANLARIKTNVGRVFTSVLVVFVVLALWGAWVNRHEAAIAGLHDESVEYCGSGVFAVDENDVIIEWSKSARELTGWRRSEVVGTKLADLLPDGMREKHSVGFHAAALRKVNRARYFLCSMFIKDGSEMKVAVVVRPFQSGFVGIIDRR